MLRKLLRRILFVQAPEGEHIPLVGARTEFVLTGLCERRVAGGLADVVNEMIDPNSGVYRLDRVRTFESRWWMKVFAGIMLLIRSHFMLGMLCRIKGVPVPPDYKLSLKQRYNAGVELRFPETPTDETLDDVRSAFNMIAGRTPMIWNASTEQVLVYDEEPPPVKPVFLCFLVHRPPGMTREQSQTYWKTGHAQLVLHNLKYLGLTQYRQVHTAAESPDGCDDTYDGIVWARKPSRGSVLKMLIHVNGFRFDNTLAVDETSFTIDTPVMLVRPRREWRWSS